MTRTGVRLAATDSALAAPLHDLTAGRISMSVAPVGDAIYGGQVEIELRETGWRSQLGIGVDEKCTLRWGAPGIPLDVPWQSCSFDLSRPVPSAQIVARRTKNTGGDVFVSEVLVEGRLPNKQPNVFILLLDAARFDMLRPFRDGAPIGDHLEKLAHDSVRLQDLHSSSSWTRPAVATLFTGLRADRHRVQERGDVLAEGFVTLAELLRDRGYSTTGWSTNPNVLRIWGMAQGFDVFMDMGGEVWASDKTDGASVLSRLHAALSVRGPEAGFYYLHLMDPHGPYQPSKAQRAAIEGTPDIYKWFPRPLAIPTSPDHWSAWLDYMGELLDTDNHVGALVQLLKDENLYESSLVLVIADHGEEFIDHGGRDHGRTLYEEVLRIPALIKLPDNRLAGSVVTNPVFLEDVLPTILDVLGVEPPPDVDGAVVPLDGTTAFHARPHVAALRLDSARQVTVLERPWKLIINDVSGAKELYDLDADPRERASQTASRPDVVEQLTGAMGPLLGHGQEGWHVLLCGTQEQSSLDLTVATDGGTPAWFGFEPGEATPLAGQTKVWQLRPALVPHEVEQAVFGRLAKVLLPEHVEMLVPPSTTGRSVLEVRAGPGAAFDYRLGALDETHSTERLALDSESAGLELAAGARGACSAPAKPGAQAVPVKKPFARIWYVAPVRSLSPDSLEPALRKRLDALGYAH